MKDKILIFIIGVLLGSIISTGAIYIYTVANNSNNSNNQTQMNGGQPPEMNNGQQNNGGQPPEMPSNTQSNTQTNE